jgi:hypothetical protein
MYVKNDGRMFFVGLTALRCLIRSLMVHGKGLAGACEEHYAGNVQARTVMPNPIRASIL